MKDCSHCVHNEISISMQAFQEARSRFEQEGGVQFLKGMQVLASDYARTDLSKKGLKEWIRQMKEPFAKEEFSRAVKHWNQSIQKVTPELSEKEFLLKADALYQKHKALLSSQVFSGYTEANARLKAALMGELHKFSPEEVAHKYHIEDSVVLEKMKHEWKEGSSDPVNLSSPVVHSHAHSESSLADVLYRLFFKHDHAEGS